MDPPEKIIAYDHLASQSKPEAKVVHYEEKEDQWTQDERHEQEPTEDEEKKRHDWPLTRHKTTDKTPRLPKYCKTIDESRRGP